MTDQIPSETAAGIDRRTMLKRGAVVGGALVWTTPIVQSIASPAFASTSPTVQGCLNPRLVATKFDGQQDGLNKNQCIPAGASLGLPEGVLFSPAIRNNDPLTGIDTVSFTLGVNDTLISVCAMGGGNPLLMTEISRTLNANGTTTFVFESKAGTPDISNFSVYFGDCP